MVNKCLLYRSEDIFLCKLFFTLNHDNILLNFESELTRKSPFTINCVETSDGENKKRHISSASSAMAIGAILGLIQSIFVIFAAKPILEYMGIKSVSLIWAFGYFSPSNVE